jgi:hypothetical protein
MKPLLSLLFLSSPAIFAQQHQIDWGTSAVTDKIITSDGSPISLAEFSIELGGFGGGFIPTAANVTDWVNNWEVFDAVTDPDTDTSGPKGETADGFITGPGATDARFVGTGFLQNDQTSSSEDANGIDTFGPNQQAYVFIRNSDTTGEDAEWLLYTSNAGDIWEYPTVAGGQPDTPDSWFVGEADTAIWGGVNGTIEGGGRHSDTSTDFILRTHTFVPEPSSASLLVLGCIALLRRRR